MNVLRPTERIILISVTFSLPAELQVRAKGCLACSSARIVNIGISDKRCSRTGLNLRRV